MPLFYQQDINESTRLGVWHITEDEPFFSQSVPLQRDITHPHKRLQHLAGRYLLKYLFDDFPYDLIRIADTRKPFLHNEQYHFSISHSGDFAAALVSSRQRVGVDVENRSAKVMKVLHKFLHESERPFVQDDSSYPAYLRETLLWSIKETVFKWHGNGGVDFSEHIIVKSFECNDHGKIDCLYQNEFTAALEVGYRNIEDLCISWVNTDQTG